MTKSNGFDGRPAGTHAESGSYFYFLEQLGSCWNTPPHPNFTGPLTGNGPFWVAHAMKNLLALWGTCVQSLGQEGPPGEGHGNPLHYFAWRIPWPEEPGKLQSMELQNQT